MTDDAMARMGLRERKRLQAMRRIQSLALDLFDAHGYDEVTIERIAEAAEVSPSSVYRYFGTKEQLVIWDEYDPMALQAIAAELPGRSPLEALRLVVSELVVRAFEEDAERIHRRLRLAYTHPAIEAASALQAYEMAGLIAGMVAHATGKDPDELDVQVFAHAFTGGLLGALKHWYATDFATPLRTIVEKPLAVLDEGLDLR